ncbi:tetratricopeptide repeat protein [Siphonobacter sp. SORGH_AS_0500]|uniref:tetratricopeptide repeat protein n=1 Tax=Siphonobacter sp. SORGH_AS_0500 TaxID=1864824 RepID=UPI0028634147|nr:tetratricopeptide repeat protein [Siphonobacter sp. SORGH_AS_0500]MDR6196959.1 tetratricopeptide (TPR) repeat protein [Siphonobacter sp. SORGH_AS_0500]
MKLKTLLTAGICIASLHTFAQDAKSLLDEGLKKAQAGQVSQAITLFNQSIAAKDDYPVRQSRGMAYSLLRQYENAVEDFTKAISFKADAKKSMVGRGVARKKLADYQGAISDFSSAIKVDPKMAEAYYNRALVYELLGNTEKACNDYKAALANGLKPAELKVESCANPLPVPANRKPLLQLSGVATDPKYGTTKTNPIKVGTSPAGEYENLSTYMDLLRDGQNKTVEYKKTGTLPYASNYAPNGKGTIEVLEVNYRDSKNVAKKTTLYITIFDFETPKAPLGFTTVKAQR